MIYKILDKDKKEVKEAKIRDTIFFICRECGISSKRYIKRKKDIVDICKTCKTKKTKLEKYGDKNYNNIEKIKGTILEKYGTKTAAENPEIKEKIAKTNIERYGYVSNFCTAENAEKSRKTKLEKYGDENYNNPEKAKKTKLEKYGDENYNNLEKTKKSNLEKYGVEFFFNSLEFNEHKKRFLEKLGVVHVSQTEMFKKKFKETSLKKYGTEHPMKNQEIKEKTLSKNKSNVYLRTKFFLESNGITPLFTEEEYLGTSPSKKHLFKCNKCNNVFEDHLAFKNRRVPRCRNCFPENRSKGEIELATFLKNDFELIENSRSFISPYEIDILIPSLKIAIEYNGEYWHLNKKNNDEIKKELVKESGYDLIVIWDNDWSNNKNKIKEYLYIFLQELAKNED